MTDRRSARPFSRRPEARGPKPEARKDASGRALPGALGPKRPQPEAIGDVLAGFLAGTQVGRAVARESLEAAWREAVGAEVAEMTRVRGYRDGVLAVEVGSSALLQELRTFYRESILASLRGKAEPLREVREISFKLGALKPE